MELGDLRAFLAVAEELSFTRAADRLNVTQPPLTRLISRLEGRLGAPLFERTTRRVRLTAAGRLLVGEAREVLARADAARRRLRDATAARSPWLGVGYTQVALYTALPRLVERLGAISPDRELRLREASTRRQVEALEAAEIDLGLLHLPVRSAHLETRVVHTERVRLAVPAHHPLAGRPGLGLADFAGESLIVHPPHEDPAMHEDILRACAAAGFAPRLRREARHETCTGLVLSGQGVHPVAAGCACLRPEGVVHLDLEGPAPAISVALARRRGAVPAGTIEALLGPGRAG